MKEGLMDGKVKGNLAKIQSNNIVHYHIQDLPVNRKQVIKSPNGFSLKRSL
jgi:hypothetical protein